MMRFVALNAEVSLGFVLNSVGLSFGFAGAVILFFFGLPPNVNPTGQGRLLLEGVDEIEKAKGSRYQRLSYWGIILIGASFLLQFVAQFMAKSINIFIA